MTNAPVAKKKEAPKKKEMLVSKEFLLFQQNLKQTAFGVRFGKTLFTNPSALTGKQITTAMRMLGLNIPKELELATEIAQAWSSGSTLVDSYQTYQNVKNAENLRTVGNATASSANLALNLAKDMGLIDEESASIVKVGTSLVLIATSSGANVGAWVSLCLEVFGSEQKAKMMAENLSKKAAYDWYTTAVTHQSWALQEHLKSLNEGKIGIFEFLSQAADDGSLLFDSAILKNPDFMRIFPGLKFIPVLDRSHSFNASVTTWYGDKEDASFTHKWRELYSMNESQAREMIFHYVFKPIIMSYVNAEYTFRDKGRASLNDAAILACMSRGGRFDAQTNYEQMFLQNLLTPSNIGDDSTFGEMPNFVKSKAFSFLKDNSLSKEQINILDKAGKIEILLKDSTAKRRIKDQYSYDEQVVAQEVYTGMGFNWKEVSNYIAMLDMIDLVVGEETFLPAAQKSLGPTAFELMPKVNDFKERLMNVQNMSLIKKINTMALGNVAYFMNTSPEKLVRVNGTDIGAGIYRTKK